MRNAISHDLGSLLRKLPKTRVRKMDNRDIGIKNKGREGMAHKSEWWRRIRATKDSILAGNGQRNNAESIEVGLATPLGFVIVLSIRHGSNASARLNSYFLGKTDPQILQPFPISYPAQPFCSGSATAGRIHSAGTEYFSFLYCFLNVFPRSISSNSSDSSRSMRPGGRVRGITYVSLRTLDLWLL